MIIFIVQSLTLKSKFSRKTTISTVSFLSVCVCVCFPWLQCTRCYVCSVLSPYRYLTSLVHLWPISQSLTFVGIITNERRSPPPTRNPISQSSFAALFVCIGTKEWNRRGSPMELTNTINYLITMTWIFFSFELLPPLIKNACKWRLSLQEWPYHACSQFSVYDHKFLPSQTAMHFLMLVLT